MPYFFLSHAADEANVARELRVLLDAACGSGSSFVASQMDSIDYGQDWWMAIRGALEQCRAVVVLVGPRSVARPWLNFEAGVGVGRGVGVVPAFHSGLLPGQIPGPLRFFQGFDLSSRDQTGALLERLAVAAECPATAPIRDDDWARLQQAQRASAREDGIARAVSAVVRVKPGLRATFSSDLHPGVASFGIFERNFRRIEQDLEDLKDFGIIGYSVAPHGSVNGMALFLVDLQTTEAAAGLVPLLRAASETVAREDPMEALHDHHVILGKCWPRDHTHQVMRL